VLPCCRCSFAQDRAFSFLFRQPVVCTPTPAHVSGSCQMHFHDSHTQCAGISRLQLPGSGRRSGRKSGVSKGGCEFRRIARLRQRSTRECDKGQLEITLNKAAATEQTQQQQQYRVADMGNASIPETGNLRLALLACIIDAAPAATRRRQTPAALPSALNVILPRVELPSSTP
jgi:hypothetical protein